MFCSLQNFCLLSHATRTGNCMHRSLIEKICLFQKHCSGAIQLSTEALCSQPSSLVSSSVFNCARGRHPGQSSARTSWRTALLTICHSICARVCRGCSRRSLCTSLSARYLSQYCPGGVGTLCSVTGALSWARGKLRHFHALLSNGQLC